MAFDPRKCWFTADQICLGNFTPAGVISVKPVLLEGFSAIYNGKEIECYELQKVHPSDAEAFQVWRLPCYSDTAVHSFLDGKNAASMVTATFSGCTFGLGTRTRDGGVLVTHANAISANGGEPQRNAQAKLTKNLFEDQKRSLHKMIEPGH
jgi:hypothetical protein